MGVKIVTTTAEELMSELAKVPAINRQLARWHIQRWMGEIDAEIKEVEGDPILVDVRASLVRTRRVVELLGMIACAEEKPPDAGE